MVWNYYVLRANFVENLENLVLMSKYLRRVLRLKIIIKTTYLNTNRNKETLNCHLITPKHQHKPNLTLVRPKKVQ